MKTWKACVKNGRLVLDETTDLPEGTVVELVDADADELDGEEREELHKALSEAWTSACAGETVPAEEVLDELLKPE